MPCWQTPNLTTAMPSGSETPNSLTVDPSKREERKRRGCKNQDEAHLEVEIAQHTWTRAVGPRPEPMRPPISKKVSTYPSYIPLLEDPKRKIRGEVLDTLRSEFRGIPGI